MSDMPKLKFFNWFIKSTKKFIHEWKSTSFEIGLMKDWLNKKKII